MLYSDKVIDHFSNPRNVGEIPDADGVGEVGNAKCGDIMKIYLKIIDNIIVDVKFRTFGCGAAVATSSMATEMILGKTFFCCQKVIKPSCTISSQTSGSGMYRNANEEKTAKFSLKKSSKSIDSPLSNRILL